MNKRGYRIAVRGNHTALIGCAIIIAGLVG